MTAVLTATLSLDQASVELVCPLSASGSWSAMVFFVVCDLGDRDGGGCPLRLRDLDALREHCRPVPAADALSRKRDATTPVEPGGHTPLTVSLCPSQEEFEKALVWYESTLKLQPEFVPAKNRIQTIQCHLMLKKGRRSP